MSTPIVCPLPHSQSTHAMHVVEVHVYRCRKRAAPSLPSLPPPFPALANVRFVLCSVLSCRDRQQQGMRAVEIGVLGPRSSIRAIGADNPPCTLPRELGDVCRCGWLFRLPRLPSPPPSPPSGGVPTPVTVPGTSVYRAFAQQGVC